MEIFYERRVRLPLCVDSKSLSKKIADDDLNNNTDSGLWTEYLWDE